MGWSLGERRCHATPRRAFGRLIHIVATGRSARGVPGDPRIATRPRHPPARRVPVAPALESRDQQPLFALSRSSHAPRSPPPPSNWRSLAYKRWHQQTHPFPLQRIVRTAARALRLPRPPRRALGPSAKPPPTQMKRALAPVDTNRDDQGGTSGARVAGAAFDGRHYADGDMVWIVARDVESVAALAGRAGFLAATVVAGSPRPAALPVEFSGHVRATLTRAPAPTLLYRARPLPEPSSHIACRRPTPPTRMHAGKLGLH